MYSNFAAVIRLSLLCLCAVRLVAQTGFISIDCGSNGNYNDKNNIPWTTDDGYIYTGINMKVGSSDDESVVNSFQGQTARSFPGLRNKDCYILPVTETTTYLIRATFLYGQLTSLSADLSFNLSVDATNWTTVVIDSGNTFEIIFKEALYESLSSEIAVCLIPNGSGNTFISALELRPLSYDMYNQVHDKQLLSSLSRYNCGVEGSYPTVRFPDDSYDRLWSPFSSSLPSINTTSSVERSDYLGDSPPQRVLQTAWAEDSSTSFKIHLELSGGHANLFYIALYFADIYLDRNSSDIRGVSISLNGEFWFQYNFTAQAIEIRSAAQLIDVGYADFTFTSLNYSTLGPILNAIEIYSQTTVGAFTAIEDVAVLTALKSNWSLTDWTGTPACLYLGTGKLSNYSINGTIPPNINSLQGLTDLWLDNNSLVGTIPYLRSLSRLQSLRLQNNKLNGSISSTLEELTLLQELNVMNNNLSGTVPQGLLSIIKTAGNPYLCLNSSACESVTKKKKTSSAALIAGIVGGLAVLGIFLALLICFLCRRRSRRSKSRPVAYVAPEVGLAQPSASHHPKRARAFSFEEVQAATKNLGKEIGKGGFGPVYYGRLADGTQVAVKVKAADSGQGATEFFNEVSLLSTVHHKNLVSLVGYCQENNEQILIYEYMEGGTLRDHLYGRGLLGPVLEWKSRIDIALNAAQGLMYLHNDCSPRIIHRDIKSSNILLGQNLFGKVGDFGISKLTSEPGEGDSARGVTTQIKGTNGYLDPEYWSTLKLTLKSDVYSFSVVLLEIICGRCPYQFKSADDSTWILVDWAAGFLREGNIHAIVDPDLQNNFSLESMWKVAQMAMFGVRARGVDRPDMAEITRGLSEALRLENTRLGGNFRSTSLDNGAGFSSESYQFQGSRYGNLDLGTNSSADRTLFDDEQQPTPR